MGRLDLRYDGGIVCSGICAAVTNTVNFAGLRNRYTAEKFLQALQAQDEEVSKEWYRNGD